jgi:hypothetical protein
VGHFSKAPKLDGLSEDEARLILTEELPALPANVMRSILADCLVPHLRKRGTKYISARRLFTTVEDIKANDGAENGEVA